MKKKKIGLLKLNLICLIFKSHYYTPHAHYVQPKKNIKNLIILFLAFLLNYYHNRQVIIMMINQD